MKKYIILVFVFLFISSSHAPSHVDHYKKIKSLKYGLYLNNKLIGNHFFTFKNEKGLFYVLSKGSFKVDKLGVVLMNYKTESEEVYKKGILIKYTSKTQQNDKIKFANVSLKNKNTFNVNGSSFKGDAASSAIIGSWWNHEIVKNSKQISPISGRIIDQKVKYLGKKNISINNIHYDALHFHFLSNDNKPNNKKKLNINVWYDSKTLLWIKSSYEKLGRWEYRLIEVQ